MRLVIIHLFASILTFTLVAPVGAETQPQLRNFSAGRYQLVAENNDEISEYCKEGLFVTQATRSGPRLVLRPSADRDQIFYMTNVNFSDADEFNESCRYDSQNRVTRSSQTTVLTYDEHHKCNNGATVLSHTRRIMEIQDDAITLTFSRSSDETSIQYQCRWVKNNH